MFRVKDNANKLSVICSKINECYVNGNRILITVPNIEASRYVDQLLWKQPEEAFLPHCISDSPTNDRIVITVKNENLNVANVLFNLCPEIIPLWHTFDIVLDLYDETHPSKIAQSDLRKAAYESSGPVSLA